MSASIKFLSLAPTTSASYPSSPVKAPVEAPVKPATASEIDAALVKSRRSSSLSSDASGKLRFLKLGPVHYGKGDGFGDWSDAVSE